MLYHPSLPPYQTHLSRAGSITKTTLNLTFSKPYHGVVVVLSNIPFHYRNCEFVVFPEKGYSPDKRDSEMLNSILWKLLPTGFDNHNGVTEVHVKYIQIIISHSLSIPSLVIRGYVVDAFSGHEAEHDHDPVLDSID